MVLGATAIVLFSPSTLPYVRKTVRSSKWIDKRFVHDTRPDRRRGCPAILLRNSRIPATRPPRGDPNPSVASLITRISVLYLDGFGHCTQTGAVNHEFARLLHALPCLGQEAQVESFWRMFQLDKNVKIVDLVDTNSTGL